MGRKMIGLILAGMISILLIAGCSSKTEDPKGSDEGAEKKEQTQEIPVILPSDARIGIAETSEDSAFTPYFIAKLSGYLISAGVPEENIIRRTGPSEELEKNARDLIKDGCSVIVIGNADEKSAPAITKAADDAKIPVLFFGTSPGEKEISRWEKKGIRACYIGSTYAKAAEKRADLLTSLDLEKIDHSKNEEIGLVILDSGLEKAGDAVSSDCLKLLEERGYTIDLLTGEEETEEEESADEEGEETEEEDPQEALRKAAKETVIARMEEYGKDLEVIFCADDTMALGALDAVSEEKRKVGHDVMIFGFDCNEESLREAASGNLSGTFFNDFLEQAGSASETILAFLRGSTAQTAITCEYVSVTVDNAQEILDISMKVQENTQTETEDEDSSEAE